MTFSRAHVYVPPSSPLPRGSEDSVRSFTSCSSGPSITTSTTSFSQSRHERALPLLPLRIESLADSAVEQLAVTPVLAKVSKGFRERQDSSRTEESIQLGQSALSRPATPEVPKRPLLRPIFRTSATSVQTKGGAHNDQPSVACSRTGPPSFRAVLAGPSPRYPPFLSDQDKLVNLKIGDRTFTTSVASIVAHPSHLKDFVLATLHTSEASTVQPTQQSTATPSCDSSYSEPVERRPSMKSLRLPSQVVVHLPSTPVAAIRSARASVFDDVPSDAGEENEDLLAKLQATAASQFLTVPPRSKGNRLSGSSFSSENPLLSFLDTTPDDEVSNPFHFAFPPSTAPQSSSDDSQPPSLSSSPTSSAFQGTSPITAGKLHDSLRAARPLDTFTNRPLDTVTNRPMDVVLDRPSEPYEGVLYFLRTGEVLRRLKYSASTAILAGNPTQDTPSRVQQMIQLVPNSMRSTLLPLLLHPTVSELEALEAEAAYLGLQGLEAGCSSELLMLRRLMETKPATPLNEQRRLIAQRLQTPVKRIRGEAGADRPRLGAHRQYHSEASVVHATKVDEDGWI